MNQIASLTTIRGLAASWVVLLHFSVVLDRVLPEAASLRPLIGAGSFAVPLFFILSGYVLGLRYLADLRSPTAGSVLRFWWLRLGRIYPVHFCTLAISLALIARHGRPTDERHTAGRFVANVLLTQAWDREFRFSWNYPSWSISSEWFAYLIFPMACVAMGRVGRTGAAVVSGVACVFSAAAYSFQDDLAFKGLVVVLPTFVGGLGLAVACPPGGSTSRPRPWAELALLGGVVLPFAVGPGRWQSSLYVALFFAFVGFAGAAGDRSAAFWRSRPLVYLGEISYSLYMTHAIAIVRVERFFPFDAVRRLPLAGRVAALFGCLALFLGTASGMYHMVERPLRDLSRRLVPAR